MRLWLQAFGATCALAATATAQQPATLPAGQVVSSNFNLNPVGNRVPSAAPPAGNTIGNPNLRPYDPSRPLDVFKGTNLSAKDVIAPVTGVGGTQNPNLLDRLYDKMGSVTKFFRPTTTMTPEMSQPVTPGIFRRNRERNKMEWRRD